MRMLQKMSSISFTKKKFFEGKKKLEIFSMYKNDIIFVKTANSTMVIE